MGQVVGGMGSLWGMWRAGLLWVRGAGWWRWGWRGVRFSSSSVTAFAVCVFERLEAPEPVDSYVVAVLWAAVEFALLWLQRGTCSEGWIEGWNLFFYEDAINCWLKLKYIYLPMGSLHCFMAHKKKTHEKENRAQK